MGERDWLRELTSALGDGHNDGAVAQRAPDHQVMAAGAGAPEPLRRPEALADAAAPSTPPPVDDELDLMGPGRSLEGWAEQLASAFDDDDEQFDGGARRDAAEAEAEAEAEDPDDDDDDEAAPALGLLRFDEVVVFPDLPVGAEAAAAAAALADERFSSLEARLARIESLLTADLDQLGPAVLADSVGELEERLDALALRLGALQVPEPVVIDVDAQFERLTERITAQARFLAAQSDTLAADAGRRDDLLRAIIDQLERLHRG